MAASMVAAATAAALASVTVSAVRFSDCGRGRDLPVDCNRCESGGQTRRRIRRGVSGPRRACQTATIRVFAAARAVASVGG